MYIGRQEEQQPPFKVPPLQAPPQLLCLPLQPREELQFLVKLFPETLFILITVYKRTDLKSDSVKIPNFIRFHLPISCSPKSSLYKPFIFREIICANLSFLSAPNF